MPSTTRALDIARDGGQPAIFACPTSHGYYVARGADGRMYQFSAGRAGAWAMRSPYFGGHTIYPLRAAAAEEAARIAVWGAT